MTWTMRSVQRHCQYVTGWDNGPKLCGQRTQNLMDSLEGKVAICVYHAQLSKPLPEWPED